MSQFPNNNDSRWGEFQGFLQISEIFAREWETSGRVDGNINCEENEKVYVLTLDVPGFNKEDVKVKVREGRILRINDMKTSTEREERRDNCPLIKNSSSQFLRDHVLSDDAKTDGLKTAINNGVLTVTFLRRPGASKYSVKPESYTYLTPSE